MTTKSSCSVSYCERGIEEHDIFCKVHWGKVPEALKSQIRFYATLNTDKPSRRWLKAVRASTACVKRIEYQDNGEFLNE